MKKLRFLALVLLIAALLPTFASADVAGVGTIIVFGLLPYLLIVAVVIIAVVILVKAIKKKKQKNDQGEEN